LVDLGCDNIRVHVAGRTAILHVPAPSCLSVGGDADGRTTISDTVLENSNVGSLMSTRQPALVAFTVNTDVLLVLLAKLLASLNDFGVATSVTHCLSGVVCVATSSIPVT